MLIHRQEYTSHHSYHSSPVGLTDWVCRNNHPNIEVQVASAYLNYGLLLQFEADRPVGLHPSRSEADYRESKSLGISVVHRTVGTIDIEAAHDVELTIQHNLLESMRGIRIFQEGGAAEYADFFGDSAPRVKRHLESDPDGGWVFEYRYSDGLQYRATLRCASADWREDSLHLGAGTHRLVLELEAQGIWPDEDYASFAEQGRDLLSPQKARQLDALSAQDQQEVSVQLESLAALARKGKLLAGAPRFLTYFGRDSLISIAVLSGVVRSELTLLGIRSVLARLSADGEVAHEETVGEFAARSREWQAARVSGAGAEAGAFQFSGAAAVSDAAIVTGALPPPQLDYHMVDDDFLLPAVLERWAQTEDPELLGRMLSEELQPGTTGFELVARNLVYCYRRFSRGLVSYHPESTVGDWRDSLGSQGVAYSYELNLGLAPAFPALVSSLRKRFPKLDDYLEAEHKADLSGLLESFLQQSTGFCVQVPGADIERKVRDWLIEAGFSPEECRVLEARLSASLQSEADNLNSWNYDFLAMALDQDKRPIGIQHNDLAFSLLFTDPPIGDLDLMLRPLETDFPLGLRTGVGILVSNPAFCDRPEIRRELTRNHYHGLVVWPLVHNLLFHGLERQISRLKADSADCYALQLRMLALQDYLRGLGPLLRGYTASELWTFTPRADGDLPQAFGLASGSSTESNPLQLWSSLGFTTVLR